MDVTISKAEYESLIEMVGRVNALRDFIKAREYVSPDDVLAILGFVEGEKEK